MARTRSPNYPTISLPDAIERVRKVYNKEHLHKADPEVVCKAMGYTGVNGASLGVLSALKKYLLLEEVGKELKVSAVALSILVDPQNSTERQEAIRSAAAAPALFATLFDEFGDSLPSDENLRAFLLKRNFAQTAVDTPIRTYRETLNFVSQYSGVSNEPKPIEEEAEMQTTEERPVDRSQTRSQPTSSATGGRDTAMPEGVKRDVWDLDEGQVVFDRPATLSDDSIEYLEAWLMLMLKKIKKEKVTPR